LAEGAALKDNPKTDPVKDSCVEAPHSAETRAPLVSAKDMQAGVPQPARDPGAGHVVNGELTKGNQDMYASGAAKSPEQTALSTPAPGKPDALERAPEVNNGADSARDLPVRPGDAPATRSDKVTYKPDDPNIKDIQPAKDRLLAAESSMSPELKASMAKHMDDLEHRVPAATAKQIAGVYDATTKLLTNSDNTSPLNQNERNHLGNDILSNAAQQHEIDQGMHNTCNVTTLEQKLNRDSPDKAAEMVANVGLTGQYQKYKDGPDGHPVKDGAPVYLDPKSLHPDGETNFRGTEAKNGDRNYASQVFDMAAINDYWQHQSPKGIYTQTNARDGQGDTGERLMYANGQEMRGPDGKSLRSPGLGTEAMAEIGKDIGLKGDYIVSTKQFQHDNSKGEQGEKRVQSYEQFKEALQKNSTTIVGLNAKDKLFTGTDEKGGAQGGHVVTVSDFRKGENGAPDEVYMRNQWGSENNKWVSVADLYKASLPPGSKPEDIPTNDNKSVPGGNSAQERRGGGQGPHDGGRGGEEPIHGGGSGREREVPVDPATSTVQHDDHVMTDEEYKKWREQVAKDEPSELVKQRENAAKSAAVKQGMIADLQAKLAMEQDDSKKWIYQAQISALDAQ